MKAEYLTLDGGRKVRIYFNMNAVREFEKTTGKHLADLDEKTDIDTLRIIAWCSAIEGERSDGKELNMTEEELGRVISMQGIVELARIIVEQSGNSGQKKSPERGRLPLIHFRKKA